MFGMERLGRLAPFADRDRGCRCRRRGRRRRPTPRRCGCGSPVKLVQRQRHGQPIAGRRQGSDAQRLSVTVPMTSPIRMSSILVRRTTSRQSISLSPAIPITLQRTGVVSLVPSSCCASPLAVAATSITRSSASPAPELRRPPITGSPSGVRPSAAVELHDSSFQPVHAKRCLTVDGRGADHERRVASVIDSMVVDTSLCLLSQNPQVVDQRAASLAGERQRRRHAFAGRRGDRERQIAFAAQAQAPPCTDRSSRTAWCPSRGPSWSCFARCSSG